MGRRGYDYEGNEKYSYSKLIWDLLPESKPGITFTNLSHKVHLREKRMSSSTLADKLKILFPDHHKGDGYWRRALLADYEDQTTGLWVQQLSAVTNYDFAGDPWMDLASSPEWRDKIKPLIDFALRRYAVALNVLMATKRKTAARDLFDVYMNLLIEPLLSKAAGLVWANRRNIKGDLGDLDPERFLLPSPFGGPSVDRQP
jgi:hypothetical protein